MAYVSLYTVQQQQQLIDSFTKKGAFNSFTFNQVAAKANQFLVDLIPLSDLTCFTLALRTYLNLYDTDKQAKKYSKYAALKLKKIINVFPKEKDVTTYKQLTLNILYDALVAAYNFFYAFSLS